MHMVARLMIHCNDNMLKIVRRVTIEAMPMLISSVIHSNNNAQGTQ